MSDKEKVQCKPRFRIMCGNEIALGPGKVDLLETIRHTGSISSAARELGLSYRRAWEMVDVMNRRFANPLIERAVGGKGGGGANITPEGIRVIDLYRGMETKARKASSNNWIKIRAMLKKSGG